MHPTQVKREVKITMKHQKELIKSIEDILKDQKIILKHLDKLNKKN